MIRAAAARNICRAQEMCPIAAIPLASVNNLFTRKSDWITYHTVVSTSDDQIAIAPGYLQRDWQKDGRHYFEYSMGRPQMQDFFAYLSARYQVQRESITGVAIPSPRGLLRPRA